MTQRRKHLGFAVAVLGLGAASPAIAAPPDGVMLFRMRCQSCHSVAAGAVSPLAPNIAGVVGRRAASTTFRYSDALKRSGLTWTRANLDKYIAAPMQLVPGTRMVIRVSNPAERAAILDFLAHTR